MSKQYFKQFVQEAELCFVKPFISGPQIEAMYTKCIDIIFNIDNDPEIDYTKGIIAHNPNYGQGKTFFFEVVHHRWLRIMKKHVFRWTSAKDLVKMYIEYGEDHLLEFISVKSLFIDDIGDEGKSKTFQRSHSKNELNVIRYVLLKRYEQWLESKGAWRTFGTTNLTIIEIGEQYDGRLSDRLKQMTYFETFEFMKKGSFRQVSTTRRLTSVEVTENLAKLEKPQEIESPDITKYLNELLLDSEDYLLSMDDRNWGFIKKALMDRGVITSADFEVIDESAIEAAKTLERQKVRKYVDIVMRNAPSLIQNNKRDEEYLLITRARCIELAENIICRRKFMELRKKENYKFL